VGLLALILLASGLLSIVAFVLATGGSSEPWEDEPRMTEPNVDPDRAPAFMFPTTARSYDPSLNAFIDRFARACLSGKYSEFRLLFTRRLEPPSERAFVSMFNACREIRIVRVDKLPELKQIPSPAYRLVAEYDLHEHAVKHGAGTRRIQVAILHEDGEWAVAPLPRGSAEQLDLLLAGTTQPAAEDAELGE
jgi:hypothetical protein